MKSARRPRSGAREEAKRERLVKDYDLPYYDADILVSDGALARYFEGALDTFSDHAAKLKHANRLRPIIIHETGGISPNRGSNIASV